MSGQHTQGRLHACSHSSKVLRDDKGAWVGDTMSVLRQRDEDEANSRRLAACWNHCEGIETETMENGRPMLERVGMYVKEQNQQRHYLAVANEQLAAARTLLADAIETFDENPHEDHEIADRIRAFLKGGGA